MIDKERVGLMIRDIERYFSDLETIHIESRKELEEPEKKHAISMPVFSIINRAIDISNEVISGSDMPQPGTYRDTFDILKNARLITPQTAERMTWLVRYRNIIAHQYYVISVEEIAQLKKKIYGMQEFLEEIKNYLRKK